METETAKIVESTRSVTQSHVQIYRTSGIVKSLKCVQCAHHKHIVCKVRDKIFPAGNVGICQFMLMYSIFGFLASVLTV